MGRSRGVNCVKMGGGRTLCTLHRGDGLYGLVRFQVAPAIQAGVYSRGPL